LKLELIPQVTSKVPCHFLNMYKPQALKAACHFLTHEKSIIRQLLGLNPQINNVVVIGSGPMAYLSLVQEYNKKYVGIDPYFPIKTMNNQSIYYLEHGFEDIERNQIPTGPCLYVFWFNVFHYVKAPAQTINRLSQPGDMVLHSTWSAHPEADFHMKSYFREVYRDSQLNYQHAITEIRTKNNDLNLTSNLNGIIHDEHYENNINCCDVFYL